MNGAALVAFARVDARNLGRDSLLAVVGTSPVLLALGLRFGYPVAERWAMDVHGLVLAPHRGFALAFMVVLHVPFIFGMLGALLVLDDRDDRTLLAIRVTPVTLRRYLAYRLALVFTASVVGLALAVPLSGLVAVRAAMVPVLLLAAACAPLVVLGTVALADNKVEGLAIVKVLGLVWYLPLATWFTDAPWARALAIVPTFWPVRALWAVLS